ncbi:MAG: right-handed parallel beta-helix repeat-containing protein, partial [Nanoarchaeota archaeon]
MMREKEMYFISGLIFLIITVNLNLCSAIYTDTGNLTQSVNDCGVLNTTNAVYNLISNVTNTTCFTINNSNITVDCGSYKITFSSYGFYSLSKNSTNIKNCIISRPSSTGGGIAIYLNNTANSTIENNIITTISNANSNYGIFLSSDSNTLSNNTITTSGGGNDGYGIILQSNSRFNTLSNNTITTGGEYAVGIYLASSNSSTLSNNAINTSGSFSHGIFISSSNSSTLSNNTITTSG